MDETAEQCLLWLIPPLAPLVTLFICFTAYDHKSRQQKLKNDRWQAAHCPHCELESNLYGGQMRLDGQREKIRMNHSYDQFVRQLYLLPPCPHAERHPLPGEDSPEPSPNKRRPSSPIKKRPKAPEKPQVHEKPKDDKPKSSKEEKPKGDDDKSTGHDQPKPSNVKPKGGQPPPPPKEEHDVKSKDQPKPSNEEHGAKPEDDEHKPPPPPKDPEPKVAAANQQVHKAKSIKVEERKDTTSRKKTIRERVKLQMIKGWSS
jgi:hypothetical protein